jgi:hypothetical protein
VQFTFTREPALGVILKLIQDLLFDVCWGGGGADEGGEAGDVSAIGGGYCEGEEERENGGEVHCG